MKHRIKFFLILKSFYVILSMMPVLSYSQALDTSNKSISDSVVHSMVNDFLIAVNSGDREIMHDFIVSNYDQNVLKRIPIFAVVSLNMGFYYETGGLGYELITTLPSESGSIKAELYNKLTQKQH